MNIKKVLVAAIISIFFFVSALFSLKDYGISWDEPIHFHRGQAYLYYFLTGKTRFDENARRSYYQNNQLPAEYFFIKDDGHPPLNGILASFFNLIFFQKLGIFGDLESYHLFNIVVSTILVTIVYLFAAETYGIFVGIIASIVVATYPLFFAESHFNIKDPAQAAFFTLTIWAFWKSLKGEWKWLLVSAISAGLALGIKFNILFLPLIIIPFLIVRFNGYIVGGKVAFLGAWKKVPSSYLFTLIVTPAIIFGIFFGTWPYLWQDPIANIISSVRWYQEIGTGQATYGIFISGGFNIFAPLWILITTPPVVIILTVAGIVTAIKKRSEYSWLPLLWLLWFLVPIARVVVPNTTIYGGVRQIMEFLPAMALIAGLGANELVQLVQNLSIKYKNLVLKSKIDKLYLLNFKLSLLFLYFAFSIYPILKLHPNENVYFNFIIGGLSGAKEKGIPYWGNSFGNAYKQATDWINQNAPANSKIALIQGTTLNIPRLHLRPDIRFSNSYWSGIYRDGEYLIELTHNDKKNYPYAWEYVESFLKPVFEVKVDGIAIAKVWKNDLDNTEISLRGKETFFNGFINKNVKGNEIIIDLGREIILTRLVIVYEGKNCIKPEAGVFTFISATNSWYEEPGSIPANQLVVREKEENPFETYFFPGRRTRFIKLVNYSPESCILNPKTSFRIYALEELK